MLVHCPDCLRKVLLKADGTCPGCAKLLGDPELESDVSVSAPALEVYTPGEKYAAFRGSDNRRSRLTWSQGESATPKHIKRALLKCKPLSDPGGAFVLFMSVALGQGIGKDLLEIQNGAGIGLLAYSILPIIALINIHILFRTAAKRAIFLRAFSRDILAKPERHFLFASMPKGVKLEGIRAPSERSNWFHRFVIEPIAAFHYLGAPNFSLEGGDHNWLARLLATLSRSRFVLVDVRTVTDYVAIELGICWNCCGPERLFFVVDDSRSESEWLDLIADLLHVPISALQENRLLRMPSDIKDTPDAIAKSRAIRAALTTAPPGEIVIGTAAFERVRSLVPERSWKTRWHELPEIQFLLSMLFFLLAAVIPMILFNGDGAIIIFGLLVVGVGIIFFSAYAIAFIRAFEIARCDQTWRNPHGLTFGYVTFAALVVIGMLGEAALAAFL